MTFKFNVGDIIFPNRKNNIRFHYGLIIKHLKQTIFDPIAEAMILQRGYKILWSPSRVSEFIVQEYIESEYHDPT